MSKIASCTMPAEDITCRIAKNEREYPTLPRREWRYFVEMETYAATIEPGGLEVARLV
jgi:hypothetical protein